MRYNALMLGGCLAVFGATGMVHGQQASGQPAGRVRAAPEARSTTVYRLLDDKRAAFNVTGVSQGNVRGTLEVRYRNGRAAIQLRVDNLVHPQQVGAAYTAYVFWGVTGDGKVVHLGEIPVNQRVDLKTDIAAQTVGFLATAEPYAEVERPSPALVLAFTLLNDTDRNAPVSGSARYLGDDGRLYTESGAAGAPDYATPILVQSARHAVAIARRAGAVEFAAAEWREVDVKLGVLEQLWPEQRGNEGKFSGLAREVIRLADRARRIGGQRADSAAVAAERQAAAARLASAAQDVEQARRLREEAERDAARARAFADSVNEVAARTLRYADSVRAAALVAQQEAAAAQEQAMAAQQEAAAARQERDAARERLASSIGAILDTKREARGLVVNLSDVLFTSGKAVLQPRARENLSKLSGILLAYPGPYTLAIGGHTDSVGSDALNDALSQARAESVRDYLLEAGIAASHLTSVSGFGRRQPVADNTTADGRAKNRRVEIVIDDADPAVQ